jgi:hypothetical protein
LLRNDSSTAKDKTPSVSDNVGAAATGAMRAEEGAQLVGAEVRIHKPWWRLLPNLRKILLRLTSDCPSSEFLRQGSSVW